MDAGNVIVYYIYDLPTDFLKKIGSLLSISDLFVPIVYSSKYENSVDLT